MLSHPLPPLHSSPTALSPMEIILQGTSLQDVRTECTNARTIGAIGPARISKNIAPFLEALKLLEDDLYSYYRAVKG